MLLSAREIRELADGAGLSPSKQRGQNFVVDPNTVRAIVERAGVEDGQVVLEVGPGLGSLTLGLLEAGADVVAIELDRGLAGLLPRTLASRGVGEDRLHLVHADALTVTELPQIPRARRAAADAPSADREREGRPTALVANLPYNVATPILLTMLERFASIERCLVMVQSEVVDRLIAQPGSRTYGAPSAKAAWYGDREWAGKISRRVFWPVPNVDSALVLLTRRQTPLGTETERRETFRVIDAAFAQRRKMLRAALAGWAGSSQRASGIIAAAGIDPTRRGETLTVHEFLAIARAVERGTDPETEPATDLEIDRGPGREAL
ncbi:16S rRNA (adenine(1518)-N(6)/adenine(1519)-N(6))-dimethyltransferase [Brachybacterium endophyticum]|uniref:Ribosomal RNA small subunit methyltransferase A n=1 Tax=Brachybacterium endophyticum TaxID=2182385 RepID=A0A2U2RML4_9MICO|nr:16S rRNA (adenine(1518)-N(6)/adenine(1519)-N(6))-dimethyltransferase RsmA [Brachybacterium endophyticum]PWH07086.1 16S rRNA (adenine(1518)-N(6)/adenine(1519)-N(6))-dimethyltransferase [Brachybacterium endophyticum]